MMDWAQSAAMVSIGALCSGTIIKIFGNKGETGKQGEPGQMVICSKHAEFHEAFVMVEFTARETKEAVNDIRNKMDELNDHVVEALKLMARRAN